jgi:hypothetical protein
MLALGICALASTASAATLTDADELGKFGSFGTGAGQFVRPGASAADPVTGHLYVLDSFNSRIDEFTPWGEFVKAFGWDVAPGAVNEQQEVRVRAGAGAFKLNFKGAETPDLPFDATAKEVKSALDGLSSIGGAGGSVTVGSLSGDVETATPFIYVVAFKGSLAGKDVAQLTAENGVTPLSAGNPKTELEVRTRADGSATGTGLESCTEESGCKAGSQGDRAGQLDPSSLAVDAAGNLYVAEHGTERVQKFTPAGHFLWAIGGDTIVDGAAGTGIVTPGSTKVTSVITTEKAFRVGQAIEGTGIEAGTTIVAVGLGENFGIEPGTITLSAPAGPAATGATTNLSVKAGPNNVPSNEKQTIALGENTTGGVFRLSYQTPDPSRSEVITGASGQVVNFEQHTLSATATTASGSPTLTSVAADVASGELTSGSKTLKSFRSAARSPFPSGPGSDASAGEGITGAGIPAGTTVTAVGGFTLTLSASATASDANVALSLTAKGTATTTTGSNQLTAVTTATGTGTLATGSKQVTGLAAASGEFRRGQTISGTGIPPGTTIVAEGTESIELSAPATTSGAQSLSAGTQPFALGQTIVGTGIPIGTTITAIKGQALTLSANATASASAVAISAALQPFVSAGMAVEGPGIPSGTTVNSVAANGDLTLSANATASAAGAPLQIGIAYNASAATLQEILEAMPNIGTGNVAVSGSAGGPWTVEFKGVRFADTDVEPLNEGSGFGGLHRAIVSGLQVSSGEGEVGVTSAKGGEVCRAAAECQGASEGLSPGQFAAGQVASAPGGAILVASDSRIQRFNGEGEYQSQLQPASLKGWQLGAFAVDPTSGSLYVQASVEKFGGSTLKLEELDPVSGNELGTRNDVASALATDPAGDLFAVNVKNLQLGISDRLVEFDPAGKQVSAFGEGEPFLDQFGNTKHFEIGGIGTNPLGDVYVGYFSGEANALSAFIRSFGPAPISLESPPLRPPEIAAQYARSVASGEAELRAKINPRFWNDTTYHLEYGTSPCSEGGCTDTAATRLSSKVSGVSLASQGVLLEGLEPGTVYHYRFVATSTGGGPVYGVDPDGQGPGGATFAEGEERTFVTPHAPAEQSCPENEAFRVGPSAILPDCRAYEMVSPLDKEGGDIVVLAAEGDLTPATLNQSSSDGERIAYGSYRSFGGAESAPWTSQYIAARHEGEGWVSHPISPPRNRAILGLIQQANPEFQAFSPDLCQGWFGTFAEPPLAPEAPAGQDDLYRRTDEECGGPAVEALNRTPSADGKSLRLGLQGVSGDGATAVFNANLPLAEGGAPLGEGNNYQLYGFQGGEERFLCVLPSGRPFPGHCTAGSAPGPTTKGQDDRIANALSTDGKLLYWSQIGEAGGLFLRVNPMAPQSALKFGTGTGAGTLKEGSKAVGSLIVARGKAAIASGSNLATLKETSVGEFVAGQPLNTVTGIPAGTKVVKVEGATLTLSNAATATNASATLTSKGPAPFAVGQTITGPRIPAATTIAAAKEGELTLSNPVSASSEGSVALESFSECTEAAKACTLPVSAAAEAEAGESGAQFWTGAADGSRALFMVGNAAAGKAKLYEYRLADRSTHLIAGKARGVLGASADASRAYLVSEEALGGVNGEGESAVAGKPNLYFHEAGGQFRFVGLLEGGRRDFSSIAASPIFQAARVSADGLHAAFVSTAPITGYDNTDVATEEADAEVFVYDAGGNGGEGKVLCASCNPSGARPVGHEVKVGGHTSEAQAAGSIPGFQNNDLYAPRALSEDGRRLFFDSYDALSPRDTNGQQDVYEWEAPGEGTCEESSAAYSAQNGGCVDLISSGKSPLESEFIDASPSGRDAFFTTLSSLVPQDFGLVDVYDAREGGGFPPPPAKPAACEGEACQNAPEAPNDPTPSSESFQGAGNVREEPAARAPKPCAKGKVRRHGKCVAKHAKKAHRRAKRKRRAGR